MESVGIGREAYTSLYETQPDRLLCLRGAKAAIKLMSAMDRKPTYASSTDGSAFAQSGIVCVAINYRLGNEGFLPIPGVPTNLGLRDMLFAARWVRENIASFGGDPDSLASKRAPGLEQLSTQL